MHLAVAKLFPGVGHRALQEQCSDSAELIHILPGQLLGLQVSVNVLYRWLEFHPHWRVIIGAWVGNSVVKQITIWV